MQTPIRPNNPEPFFHIQCGDHQTPFSKDKASQILVAVNVFARTTTDPGLQETYRELEKELLTSFCDLN